MVQRVKKFSADVSGGSKESEFAVFGYRGSGDGAILTLWRSSDTPGQRSELERVTLTTKGFEFEQPVWVDMLTGRVYEMNDALWTSTDQGATFQELVVYDSAVVLAERTELERLTDLTKPANETTSAPTLKASVTIHNAVSLGRGRLNSPQALTAGWLRFVSGIKLASR